MPRKKKEPHGEEKIVSLHVDMPTDDEKKLELLRARMSPTDRQNYDLYVKSIEICMETGKVSGVDKLIKNKEEIEQRYILDDEEEMELCFDDQAYAEAVGEV